MWFGTRPLMSEVGSAGEVGEVEEVLHEAEKNESTYNFPLRSHCDLRVGSVWPEKS